MNHFLMPVLALIVWTFVIWALMYKRRIPAMGKVSADAQDFIRQPDLMNQLPGPARWAADNYNHLHEQPTVFYALALVMFVTQQTGAANLYLAGTDVALRVIHSLVQVTSNRVLVRFSGFALSSVVLMILTARAVLGLLGQSG